MHLKAIPVPTGELTEEVTHFVVRPVCPMIARFDPQFAILSFGNTDENLVKFSLRFLDCGPCRWLLLFSRFGHSFSPGAVFLPPQQPVVQDRLQLLSSSCPDSVRGWIRGWGAGHRSVFAGEACPLLQLQCRQGDGAGKITALFFPGIPKDRVLGRSSWRYLLLASKTTLKKRAVEASA